MLDHQYIKKLAADAGFDLCGLAPCRHLVENESMLRAWLGKGYQSSLAYMERNVEKRAGRRRRLAVAVGQLIVELVGVLLRGDVRYALVTRHSLRTGRRI